MSAPSDKQAELRALLQRLSDDQLGPEDAQRLNDLLHGDPEACELYLDHITLEAHLRREFGGQRAAAEALPAFVRGAPPAPTNTKPSIPPVRVSSATVFRFTTAALLGAAFAFTCVFLLQSKNGRQAGKQDDGDSAGMASAGSVATLLFADNCQWGKNGRLVEGQRLVAGSLLLERGLAVLRFDGGAAVVLEGPTELELVSRGFARLASGRLTVRAPEEAAGFTVRTPASDVVDLGTEFAVVVERGGATELHVLEGEVAYGKPGVRQETADLLAAGKAVRYDQPKESAPRAVPVNAPRFSELLGKAKVEPRQDVLLAHEGFDYPVGRLPLTEAKGGFGWTGPWRISPGVKSPPDEGELTIASGKLTVPWSVQGGRGPMLEATPDYVSRTRTLAQPVRLDEDGVYYVSVLVRWETPPTPVVGQTMPAVRIVLRSSTDFQGDRVMFNLPLFQRPQIDIRSGAIFTSSFTVKPNQTQLWVGKIVARKHGEDEIFFRVYGEDEPLDPMEPATSAWSVRTRGIYSDAKLDLVLLSKFGGGTCWWDEVRIGKTWRSVVPMAALAKNPN
jgi:hypothetical protein